MPPLASAGWRGIALPGHWLTYVLGRPSLALGSCIVGLVLVATLWPGRLAPYGPEQRAPVMQEVNGRIGMAPYAPESRYLLGTDDMGRDLLSRIIYGAQVTLPLAIFTALVRIVLGMAFGWIAIGAAGDVRRLVLALANASATMPSLFFAYLVIAAIGPAEGIAVYILGIGLTGWAPWTQLIFNGVQRVWSEPYMEGATAVGSTMTAKVRHYLLPNLMPVVLPSVAQEIGATLLIVAELGFVGLYRGVPRLITIDDFRTPGRLPPLPVPEWGGMLAGTRFEVFSHYWIPLAPAAAFAVTIFGFYLFAEGLRSALDIPRQGGRSASLARQPGRGRAVWQRRAAAVLPALLAVIVIIALIGQRVEQAGDTQPLPTTQPEEQVQAQATAQSDLLQSAHTALNYGFYDLAEKRFRAVLTQDPDNEEAQTGLQAVEQGRQQTARYDEAKRLADAGQWAEALPILRTLLAERSDYPGAAELLAEGERAILFAEAEAAYEASDWATAIAKYRAVRQSNLLFQREQVTERLFNSLMQEAPALTNVGGNDSTLLQEALDLYDEALRLRPRDEQATAQSTLLQTYLKALAALGQGDQTEAASQLAQIWQQQPDFAGGEAASRLANLYLDEARLAAQQDDAARAQERYTQVITITQSAGTSLLDLLVPARLEMADVLQQDGEFALAVEHYLAAVVALEGAASANDLLTSIGRPASLFALLAQIGDISAERQDWFTAATIYHLALTEGIRAQDGEEVARAGPSLAQGEAALEQGNYQQAVAIYQQAIIGSQSGLQNPVVYAVVAGDTLSAIAARFGTTVQAIVDLNQIEDPSQIAVGQELLIHATVQP